ncbi:MAG: hypothetical protein FIB05_16980 [Betaproteobacteria bacterium]|nr:hypothetical protein [Betaproteobacteria bacterium]PWB60199.1 MAG: hypothetical protein C3F16_10875 [Betaproteobacteria bacterium]
MNRNRNQAQPQAPQVVPGTAAELEDVRVIERPDGFWVQPIAGGHESGPYASLVEAIESYRTVSEVEEFESEESLAEMEAQVGVADWIDPDTSAPAEDRVPHIEEH